MSGEYYLCGIKAAIHHKGGSAPDGLLPVEFDGELHFCNGPSLLDNAGENDSRMEDLEEMGRLPEGVVVGWGLGVQGWLGKVFMVLTPLHVPDSRISLIAPSLHHVLLFKDFSSSGKLRVILASKILHH